VIVGGLITTVWSWLAVVRQELSDAMVSARPVDDDLAALDEALRSNPGTQINGRVWKKNRTALARVLGKQQWEEVSAVYRHYAHPLPSSSLHDEIAAAQGSLAKLVSENATPSGNDGEMCSGDRGSGRHGYRAQVLGQRPPAGR
jgi:hypothetical protein